MLTTSGWKVEDLERFPQPWDDTRYEIIRGELYVSRQPHNDHQMVTTNTVFALRRWDPDREHGVAMLAPGVIYGDEAAAPDVVWASHETMAKAIRGGKFYAPPDLMVEVLSYGTENEQRDREAKLEMYGRWGVKEYWILDRAARAVEVYRHDGTVSRHVATHRDGATLASPLLPGFACPVADFFAGLLGD